MFEPQVGGEHDHLFDSPRGEEDVGLGGVSGTL
jgi:hypothetical protein